MRLAIIENGVVVNIIIADNFDIGQIEATGSTGIGHTYADGVFSPPVDPPPDAVQIIAALTAAVQSHLDAAAKARGYDGILSAASYAGDSHPPFNLEGVAFRDWRGAVWSACYSIMADVQGGLRPAPDAATLIAELPVLALL